jgi:hypothetical protein
VLPATRGAARAYAGGVPRVEGKHEPIVRSEFLLKLVALKITILQDLHHEPSADSLTPVNRNNRATSIRVLKEMVTTLDPDDREAQVSQSPDSLLACNRRKSAHALTATLCTPTNSESDGVSTSRQSSMASRMRFIKTSNDFACV